MLETGKMISTIESRQNLKIACLEEIAFNNNWITKKQVKENLRDLKGTSYGKYLIDTIL